MLRIANREARLTLRQMFVYAMFAYFRSHGIGEDGYVGLDEITANDLEKVCLLFVEASEGETAMQTFSDKLNRSEFIYTFDVKSVQKNMLEEKRANYQKYKLNSPRDAVVTIEEANKKVLDSYRQTLDRITERLVEAKIDSKFDIERKGVKGGYIFGLNIDPDQIKFE